MYIYIWYNMWYLSIYNYNYIYTLTNPPYTHTHTYIYPYSSYSIIGTPTLILDSSHYQASIKLRQLLTTTNNHNSISNTMTNIGVTSTTGGIVRTTDIDGSSSISSTIGNSNTFVNSSSNSNSNVEIKATSFIYYDVYE